MTNRELYDDYNPLDIERYGKNLIGLTFRDVLEANIQEEIILEERTNYYNNPRAKGGLGNLIEEFHFGYKPNNSPEPDFPNAGVELKVAPYEEKKKGGFKSGERLVLGMVPNDEPLTDNLLQAKLFNKIKTILLVLYLRKKGDQRTNFMIDYVKLFSIISDACKNDFPIIENDYKKIVNKIQAGEAHTISEGDTLYLGACTKGADAKKSLQPQYYNANIPAKRRAYCFKQSYVTHIINEYILNNVSTYDSIIKDDIEILDKTFEEVVLERISKFIGKDVNTLSEIFKLKNPKGGLAKNFYSQIALRMLGVQSSNAEEFDKANIVIKSIRIQENNKNKESMSFPALNFKKFVNEQWEESEVYNFFSETKFLFMVFKEEKGQYVFKGGEFWNMPLYELDSIGKKEWLSVQRKIKRGVHFEIEDNRVLNDLPKSTETQIFHLRPHAAKSIYRINGKIYGNGDINKDADELPNGDKMTKQCFWLNRKYVLEIVKNMFEL